MEVVGRKIKMLGQKMSFRTKNWNLGQNKLTNGTENKFFG